MERVSFQLTSLSSDSFSSLWYAIGSTPVFEIVYMFKGERRTIYAKSEIGNLTGSIKDRMALYIIQKAYEDGTLTSGDTIIEVTSGNTGISFAAIGRKLGHPVKIIMPSWLSRERKSLIRTFGAEIIPISKEMGGFVGGLYLAKKLASEIQTAFLPNQFSNKYNVQIHERTTGRELWDQLRFVDKKPDAFVAGVGSGGTVMGVGRYLKSKNPDISIHPLEPAESPTLTKGQKDGEHRIQGISDEFIPEILKLSELDSIIQAHDGDSILLAQKLASQLGLGVGISSGANFLGAIQVQNVMGDNACVATVFSDCNKKYFSTDLMNREPVRNHYLTPHVEFLGYNIIPRVTNTSIL